MKLIKVKRDLEKVKSILEMVELIEIRKNLGDKNKLFPLILSDYYEIIKELSTALLLCRGFKTLSHIDLLEYIKKKFSEFDPQEKNILDRLRIFRNRSVYEGFKIPKEYLDNNESYFKGIIKKLKFLIIKEIKRG